MVKKIYIIMTATVLLSIIAVLGIEYGGYQSIKVQGGTLYGKVSGNNKDLVVLILAGSGPTDMDGNSSLIKGRNDSLLELSKVIGKEGISTFRYDKRTAGKSVKTFNDIDIVFDTFVDDCIEVIKYLKKQGYKKIIVAGHSKGSLVGMLAAQRESVNGFISIGGPGYPVDVSLEKQLLRQLSEDSPEIRVIKNLREGKIDSSVEDDTQMFSVRNQRFMLSWMKYNPSEEIGKLSIPVAIIHGEADLQVFDEDFEALKTGRVDADYISISNMNHVLKKIEDTDQNISSYLDPAYPIHQDLVKFIRQFLKKFK